MTSKVLSKNTLWNARTPVKKRRVHFTFREHLRRAWGNVLVFFGLRVWAHAVYPRPKYQPCPFGHGRMKRGAVTTTGAYYICTKCPRTFHLEGGGKKLVAVAKQTPASSASSHRA